MNKSNYLDINQNFWQLACIQGSALGLPGILIGGLMAECYGASGAIISIIIGNLILWGLAYAIISMSSGYRDNAIENVKKYIGVLPCIFATLVLTIGFLGWSLVQNQFQMLAFESLTSWDRHTEMRVGSIIILTTAFISFGNIHLIKKVCVWSFPFLFLCGFVKSILSFKSFTNAFEWSWNVPFFAVVAITAQNLPGIVNLPTFFRHSRSKLDSLLALTLMTLFVAMFQIFSVISGIASPIIFFQKILPNHPSTYDYIIPIAFVILATLCVNLVNIYFASAGWEAISNILRSSSLRWTGSFKTILRYILVPINGIKYVKSIGILCMINGIFAAMIFLIFLTLEQAEFIEALADNSLASLGVILMLAFLTRIFERRRPKLLEFLISSISWLIGALIGFFVQIQTRDIYLALTIGVITSFLSYLGAIFFEVTYYSISSMLKESKQLK